MVLIGNGLSATITELVLGILLIISFIILAVGISYLISKVIKHLLDKGQLNFIRNNDSIHNFIRKDKNLLITLGVIIFILILILPSGIVSSQVSAGESGLFENVLYGTTNSLLSITIDILTFIGTILILFIASAIVITLIFVIANNRN